MKQIIYILYVYYQLIIKIDFFKEKILYYIFKLENYLSRKELYIKNYFHFIEDANILYKLKMPYRLLATLAH